MCIDPRTEGLKRTLGAYIPCAWFRKFTEIFRYQTYGIERFPSTYEQFCEMTERFVLFREKTADRQTRVDTGQTPDWCITLCAMDTEHLRLRDAP